MAGVTGLGTNGSKEKKKNLPLPSILSSKQQVLTNYLHSVIMEGTVSNFIMQRYFTLLYFA